jgi:hypothetical protein
LVFPLVFLLLTPLGDFGGVSRKINAGFRFGFAEMCGFLARVDLSGCEFRREEGFDSAAYTVESLANGSRCGFAGFRRSLDVAIRDGPGLGFYIGGSVWKACHGLLGA